MPRTKPYTHEELNILTKHWCASLVNRVINHRIAGNDYCSTKDNRWDINITAVSCSSNKSYFYAVHAHNCTTLKSCHPNLAKVLPGKLGEKPHKATLPTITGYAYPIGHCAEPHAAQKLLNAGSKVGKNIQVPDIIFSLAIDIKNGLPKEYCRTCKISFKQLR